MGGELGHLGALQAPASSRPTDVARQTGNQQATVVGFLAVGESGEDDLIASLEREVVRVERVSRDVLDAESGPKLAVTLCWLPADCDWQILTDLAAWKGRASSPSGLIGIAASGDVSDRETGLSAGFDDFVVGPVSAKEVAARARALARRLQMKSRRQPSRLSHGPLAIDVTSHQLWVDGERFALTRTEMGVLRELVRARGRTRSRAEILDAAWGPEAAEVGERAVDNVILRLRRKLGRPGLIVTVRGVGFRLAD